MGRADNGKGKSALIAELEQLRERLSQCEAREQAACERAEYLQEILDSCDEIIQVHTARGELAFANKAIEKHSGFTIEEYTEAQYAGTMYPPEDIGLMMNKIQEVLESPSGSISRGMFRAYDKVRKLHLLDSSFTNRPEPPICGFVSVAREVSNEESNQWESWNYDELIHMVFNSVHDALILHEADGKIVQVNDRFLEMFEVGQHDAYTSLWLSGDKFYGPPESETLSVQDMWRQVINGRKRLFEGVGTRLADQTKFSIEVFLTSVQPKDQRYVLASIRDITERKTCGGPVKGSIGDSFSTPTRG